MHSFWQTAYYERMWLCESIIWSLILRLSFPGEVVRVALLSVPSRLWIQNIISPAHHFAILYSSGEVRNLHWKLWISVSSGACEVHQRAFVSSPWLKFNYPVLSYLLILRVVVDMFPLGVIYSCNFTSVKLAIPHIRVNVEWSTCSLIKLFSLI